MDGKEFHLELPGVEIRGVIQARLNPEPLQRKKIWSPLIGGDVVSVETMDFCPYSLDRM